MVGTHAGDMIGEIVFAIEMGADAVLGGSICVILRPGGQMLSQSPMLALHRAVTQGPCRAKHLHNLHQAQPLGNGIDPSSVAQRRLKGHPCFARQHRICTGTV